MTTNMTTKQVNDTTKTLQKQVNDLKAVVKELTRQRDEAEANLQVAMEQIIVMALFQAKRDDQAGASL